MGRVARIRIAVLALVAGLSLPIHADGSLLAPRTTTLGGVTLHVEPEASELPGHTDFKLRVENPGEQALSVHGFVELVWPTAGEAQETVEGCRFYVEIPPGHLVNERLYCYGVGFEAYRIRVDRTYEFILEENVLNQEQAPLQANDANDPQSATGEENSNPIGEGDSADAGNDDGPAPTEEVDTAPVDDQ